MKALAVLLLAAGAAALRRTADRALAARGGAVSHDRSLFAAEELEHPFSAFAEFLCQDEELGEKGPKRVRRALLALSMSSKALKATDGVKAPYSLCYDGNRSTLVVTMDESDTIKVFDVV